MKRPITDADIRPGIVIMSVHHHTHPLIISERDQIIRLLIGRQFSCLTRQSVLDNRCYCLDDTFLPFTPEELQVHLARLGIQLDT